MQNSELLFELGIVCLKLTFISVPASHVQYLLQFGCLLRKLLKYCLRQVQYRFSTVMCICK